MLILMVDTAFHAGWKGEIRRRKYERKQLQDHYKQCVKLIVGGQRISNVSYVLKYLNRIINQELI